MFYTVELGKEYKWYVLRMELRQHEIPICPVHFGSIRNFRSEQRREEVEAVINTQFPGQCIQISLQSLGNASTSAAAST